MAYASEIAVVQHHINPIYLNTLAPCHTIAAELVAMPDNAHSTERAYEAMRARVRGEHGLRATHAISETLQGLRYKDVTELCSQLQIEELDGEGDAVLTDNDIHTITHGILRIVDWIHESYYSTYVAEADNTLITQDDHYVVNYAMLEEAYAQSYWALYGIMKTTEVRRYPTLAHMLRHALEDGEKSPEERLDDEQVIAATAWAYDLLGIPGYTPYEKVIVGIPVDGGNHL